MGKIYDQIGDNAKSRTRLFRKRIFKLKIIIKKLKSLLAQNLHPQLEVFLERIKTTECF